MATETKDGGPAFPHLETTSRGEPFHDHLGMTVRQWYAGQALIGLLAQPDQRTWSGNTDDADGLLKWRKEICRSDAEVCFRYADAMLAAGSGNP